MELSVRAKIALRLILGLIMISALIYISKPIAVISTLLSAQPFYLALAVILYPLAMLAYTLRWYLILQLMGERLPLSVAHQALVGSAFVSDFTPARIGDFIRPMMVKEWIKMEKGMASVIVDHWADFVAGAVMGIIGLLGLFAPSSRYFIPILILLLALVAFLSLILIRGDVVMEACWMIGYERLICAVESFYTALGRVKHMSELVEGSLLLTIVVWIIYSVRILEIVRALGYNAPLYHLIFLMPLVNMLSAIPIAISGLGLVEGGMAAVMVALGLPPSLGVSAALIDRAISMAYHALVGSRYATKWF